jgi:hypothetical protein
MPFVVNGSLWTLPLEFFCYITVAIVGVGTVILRCSKEVLLALCVLAAVLAAHYGVQVTGVGYTPYFEMVAMFWWGVYYGRCLQVAPKSYAFLFVIAALLGFAILVMWSGALRCSRLRPGWCTCPKSCDRCLADDYWGSPMVYIFAFPVQQLVAFWARRRTGRSVRVWEFHCR